MPTSSGERIRIQKLLSRAGIASRREAEELMLQGRVRVNGQLVTELGSRVDPEEDLVEVDGRVVRRPPPRWILFHKPPGCLTSRTDPRGRPTVYDHLPADHGKLRYVGRLDLDTRGLLILTNEGDAIHGLTHPSSEVEREYEVQVRKPVGPDALRQLEEGVRLEDGRARARRAEAAGESEEGSVVRLVLTEGRKREVRRMMDAIGHPVSDLTRIRFGSLRLDDLPEGEWRELDDEEVRSLRRSAGLEG